MSVGAYIREVFADVPWSELGLTVAGVWLMTQLYRMHVDKESRFLLSDMVVDKRGRADLYKLVVIVMAALSVFTILRLLEREQAVETILLGTLGIFVGGRAFNAAFAKPENVVGDEIKSEEGK
jgi:hypothetical protein